MSHSWLAVSTDPVILDVLSRFCFFRFDATSPKIWVRFRLAVENYSRHRVNSADGKLYSLGALNSVILLRIARLCIRRETPAGSCLKISPIVRMYSYFWTGQWKNKKVLSLFLRLSVLYLHTPGVLDNNWYNGAQKSANSVAEYYEIQKTGQQILNARVIGYSDSTFIGEIPKSVCPSKTL